MALIVRGILGAGIQDLPGSLTADGLITSVPMALTTVGALALLSRRAAAAATGPTRRWSLMRDLDGTSVAILTALLADQP